MKNVSTSAVTGLVALLAVSSMGVTFAAEPVSGVQPTMQPTMQQGTIKKRSGAKWKKSGGGINVDRMAKKLNLSDEQRTQIDKIVEESKPAIDKARTTRKENAKKLDVLVKAEKYNQDEVKKLAEAQGKLEAESVLLRTKQRFDIRSVLNEEQRVKWDKMRKRGKRNF